VNLVIDSQFATSLQSGSVSFLYYANRVTELTLGIFAISLSTVILPTLSRATADQNRERVRSILSTAMRLLMFISIPATLGLIILRVPIIQVLFERGRFTHQDTLLTSGALAYYAIGLLPYAAVNVLATAFYAHRDTRTPVKIGVLTFFLHLALNFALRGPMRHAGIALSTSLSALVDGALLAFLLRRHAGRFLDGDVARTAWHTLAGGAAMTVALLAAVRWVDVVSLHGIGAQALALGALIAGGGAVYVLVLVLLGSQEVRLLASVVRPPR
jgi:putative peptidoglycan lipid II flippase